MNPYSTEAVLSRAQPDLASVVETLIGRAPSRAELAAFAGVIEQCREPHRTAELHRLYNRYRAAHFDNGTARTP